MVSSIGKGISRTRLAGKLVNPLIRNHTVRGSRANGTVSSGLSLDHQTTQQCSSSISPGTRTCQLH